MSDPTYPTPAQFIETETEVKKSRFIARATKVTDRQSAIAFVEQAKQDYPGARHHCWAYLLGNPASASSAAANDAGEPSGTAGKPILNVIQHKGVGDVIVVVIRYFGGIKLGAGGLVRAYSGAAEAVMSMGTEMKTYLLEVLRIKPGKFIKIWGKASLLKYLLRYLNRMTHLKILPLLLWMQILMVIWI